MDVTCERCATEYELDDALVSERGTTVACTSCGYQFQVFRPETGSSREERWIVERTTGQRLVFGSLPELQRAIEGRRVVREDQLSRGDDPPRPLGAIAELETFFVAAESRSASTTLRPGPPQPGPERPSPAPEALPPPPPPRESVSMDPTPSDFLGNYGLPPAGEAFVHARSRRSRGLRTMVGLVIFGALAFVALTHGRSFLEQTASEAQTAPAVDGRFTELLAAGEAALERGDVEGAKEAFDKASVLSSDHPRLLTGLARLALIRADIAWLKLRLLENEPSSVREAAERAQEEAAARARSAVEILARAQPSSDATLRSRIDALRMEGEVADARALVAKAGHLVAQPETAYTLAMLDLAEETPSLPTILDRLRTATAIEQLRARPALVYVLVRADNLAAAKSELEKLLDMPHSHPLAPELQAFVARAEGEAKSRAPSRKGEEPKEPVQRSTTDSPQERAIPTNHHELLRQAARAKARGELDRADELYRVALERNPSDIEALGALGDIARARGHTATALSFYERAHRHNPHYLPVIEALAEMRLQSGDVQGARSLFRRIVETAPGTVMATRAEERLRKLETPKPGEQPAAEIDPSDPTDLQR